MIQILKHLKLDCEAVENIDELKDSQDFDSDKNNIINSMISTKKQLNDKRVQIFF